ncbi:uncharacterized protein [Eurosta solidaginis]|uniref:uncharacterized protein n=1 Tax=Eurosta solidaginis TaxID=178769 RepID=UPI0035314810
MGASGGTVRRKKYASKAYATISGSGKATVSRAETVRSSTAPSSRRRPKKTNVSSMFSPEPKSLEFDDTLSPALPQTPSFLQLNRKSDDGDSVISGGSAKSYDSIGSIRSVSGDGNGDLDSGVTKPKLTEEATKAENSKPRRKESFLRKTLRAAVAGSRSNEIQAMRQQVIDGGGLAATAGVGTLSSWRQVERSAPKHGRRKKVQDLFEQTLEAFTD